MSTQVGQVRQHYQIKTTTEGAGLTEQHHLEGVTSEVWTGTEWVDVRELVAVVRGVLALAEELEEDAQRQVDDYAPDSDELPAVVGRCWVNAARQFRAVVAAAHTEEGAMSETVTERGPCTECGTPHAACVGPDYCCDECLHLDANWDGYEQPEPARPVGGDTREAVREEIARAMFDSDYGTATFGWDDQAEGSDLGKTYYRRHADAVLALPAVRAALDAQERLADDRNPQVCPRCGNWCVYDGWDHVHGSGIGIGSCADGDR